MVFRAHVIQKLLNPGTIITCLIICLHPGQSQAHLRQHPPLASPILPGVTHLKYTTSQVHHVKTRSLLLGLLLIIHVCMLNPHSTKAVHSDALRFPLDPRRCGHRPTLGCTSMGDLQEERESQVPMQTMADMARLHALTTGQPPTGHTCDITGDWVRCWRHPTEPLASFPNWHCLSPCPCFTDRSQTGFKFLRDRPTVQDTFCTSSEDPLRPSRPDPPGQPNSGPKVCGARMG